MSEKICTSGHVMNQGDEICRRCKNKPMDDENKQPGAPEESGNVNAENESALEPTPEVAPESTPESSPDAEGGIEGPEVSDEGDLPPAGDSQIPSAE